MENKPGRSIIDEKELSKRRRERIIMVVVGVLAIIVTLMASQLFNKENLPLSTNIFVYGLTSINFILIVLLMFLIIRNIVKLFYEHRRGVIGSRLRTKLVAAFVGLSLVPTILLFCLRSIFFLTVLISGSTLKSAMH